MEEYPEILNLGGQFVKAPLDLSSCANVPNTSSVVQISLCEEQLNLAVHLWLSVAPTGNWGFFCTDRMNLLNFSADAVVSDGRRKPP